MEETVGSSGIEERHFGRRLLAFLLDAVVASLIVALVFGAIKMATGIDLGSPSPMSAIEGGCEAAPADHPQVVRVEGMWPLSTGETRENLICGKTSGQPDQILLFVTRVVGKTETASYSSEVSYPVDAKGQPLDVKYSIDWRPMANLLLFVVFTAGGRRTPGKSVMALRATGDDGGNLSWLGALAREALKFLPFLCYFAVTIWLSLSPPAILSRSDAIVIAMRDGTWFSSTYAILMLAFLIGTALWWAGPFLRWRGETWYDLLAGTKVIRTDLGKTNARPPA